MEKRFGMPMLEILYRPPEVFYVLFPSYSSLYCTFFVTLEPQNNKTYRNGKIYS